MKSTYLNLNILLFFLFTFIISHLNGQSLFEKNFVHYKLPSSDLNLVSLNFHLPAEVENKLAITDADKNLNNISIFAVFQNHLDINEILEIENKNFQLSQDKVIGFEEVSLSKGSFRKLITYQESVDYNIRDQRNQLKPSQKDVLYEVIIFPYSVSSLQRKKIETYLGIKYSISLAHDYISGKGEVIFDVKENEKFSQNIFGLGRDDVSGLYQKQSMDNSEILQLSMGEIQPLNKDNTSEIEDQNFLFISDDGEDISFTKKQDEMIFSSKTWKAQIIGNQFQNEKFELYLDLNKLSDSMSNGNQYWLVILQNDNNSDFKNAIYLPFNEINEEKNGVVIKDLNFKNLTNDFLFTLARSDDFSFTYELQKENCHSNGEIKVKVEGNDSDSYLIELTNLNTQKTYQKSENEVIFSDISEGNYQLSVSNKSGKTITEELVVGPTQNEETENISITANEHQTLNAKEFISEDNIDFWWEYNGKVISKEPMVTVIEQGEYTLYMENDKGCLEYQKFAVSRVTSVDDAVSEQLVLAPNPVKANQEFNIYVNFKNSTDIIVSIYTLEGSLIDKEKIYQRKNTVIHKKLSQTGSYIVIVESPSNILKQKLIVN